MSTLYTRFFQKKLLNRKIYQGFSEVFKNQDQGKKTRFVDGDGKKVWGALKWRFLTLVISYY